MDGDPGSVTSEAGDADIVARIRNGSSEAFRILVQRHQGRLYRYAVRMTGDADVAMDLVQGALIRAYDRIDQCREPARFGQWVLAILANASRHHLRRQKEHVPISTQVETAGSPAERPDRAAERSELRAWLAAALGRLPADQREAFLLRHMEGLSYSEMVEVIGASVAALKQRVHRARERLEELLEEIR